MTIDPRSVPKRLRLPAMDSDLDAYEIHLTPTEVAIAWRLHVGTLRNWRAAGAGPDYIKLSDKDVIYPLSAILQYERDHRVTVHKKTRALNELRQD